MAAIQICSRAARAIGTLLRDRLTPATACAALLAATGSAAGQLFVGLEGSAPPTRSTDLSGFPNVVWDDHFAFDVSGAAASPDGTLYLCNGAFTTKLYTSTLNGPPVLRATLDTDMHALAFGRGRLYGYSNFAAIKGIYEIDINTGVCTLVLDVYTNTGFRYFGLDYNPADDLFYGYTEYGDSGLYSINIDTGAQTKVVGPIPASNSQGRGLAVGRNTVYITATRGDDGIPQYAYDLSQGPNGTWVAFTQPYPNDHATGGAAYIPRAGYDIALHLTGECPGQLRAAVTGATPGGRVAFIYARGAGSVRIPNGPCTGTQLGLDASATLAALLTADGGGNAALMRSVGANLCGGAVLLQTLDATTCTPSNVAATP
ncbi:MAG: hypothetical protein IT430_06690 [Phycisphaerales bacterium]|nr:hypothetical protein [Phycisphaerales bacterium]